MSSNSKGTRMTRVTTTDPRTAPATGTTAAPPTDAATPPTPPGKSRPYVADMRTHGVIECYGANYSLDPLGREPLWVNTPAEYVNSHLARGYPHYVVRLPTGQNNPYLPTSGPKDYLVPTALWACLTPQQQKACESIPSFQVYGSIFETPGVLDSIDMTNAAAPDMTEAADMTHHANIHRAWRGPCPGYKGQIYDMGAYGPLRLNAMQMCHVDRKANLRPVVEAIPCINNGGTFTMDEVMCRYAPSYAMLNYLDARDPQRRWIVPTGVEVRIVLSIWNFGGYAIWMRPDSDPVKQFAMTAATNRATELRRRGFCLAVMEQPLDAVVRGVTGE